MRTSISGDIVQLLKVLLGFFSSVLVPGYLVSYVLFPDRSEGEDSVYRLGLSGGLGLAAVILVGAGWILLFGHIEPWVFPIIPLMLSFFVYLSNKLLIRRVHSFKSVIFHLGSGTEQGLKLAAGVVIVGTGVLIGGYLSSRVSGNEEYFTEFWVLGPDGTFSSCLDALTAEPQSIQLGIVSHEAETTEYTVLIRTETQLFDQLGPLVLEVNDKWEGSYIFDATRIAGEPTRRLIVELHRNSAPYRLVYLAVTDHRTIED
jgi:uncharacterized membrane protein